MSKKTSFLSFGPCSAKLVIVFKNLSAPIERGHFHGLETRFITSETQRVRNCITATTTREDCQNGSNGPFLIARC